MNPIERRLKSDYEKVQKLCNESGNTLKLVKIIDNPPTSYVLEYHCPSLVKNGNEITIRYMHQVEFNLGMNYPLSKPTARMLTPVFNPHVFSYDAICLGVVWNAAETLDLLILRVGALLQLDPIVLDEKSPANIEANEWVKRNRSRLPIGKVNFLNSRSPQNRIQWVK